jgi:hypothetical protein
MDLTGQIALVRRIQDDLLSESDRLSGAGKYFQASDCADKAKALNEVLTSLENLGTLKKTSVILVDEIREALAGLPLAFQDRGKKS